jgi:large subunit ribosomal protein L15
MQLHLLKRAHPNKKDRIVGRGGKRGKTSGRGGKGQTARAGNKRRPELRDIIKKLPKHRGFQFNSIRKPIVVQKKNGEQKKFSVLRKKLGLRGGKIKIK